jgi:hypothetical protein
VIVRFTAKDAAMSFYMSAKVWEEQNQAPNTSKKAKPVTQIAVKKATVIVVKDAQYRGATISGTLLLGDRNQLPLPRKGRHPVEVYCCWYGLRLKTRGLRFSVNMSDAEVIADYSGQVVSNLAG